MESEIHIREKILHEQVLLFHLHNFTVQRILLFILILMLQVSISAQQRYFYKGRNFGSEALYNPVYLLLNGGYDILQLQGHDRNPLKFNYEAGAKNIFKNLGDPFAVIRRTGTKNFFSNELFPIDFTRKGAQWWPNYQLHLIGGGMTYTATKEWYEENKFPFPSLLSILTMGSYHLLNEIVENGNYVGDNVDPVADIYFFDIGGIVLFSFDGVNKFFSEELNLSDWSLQPSFVLKENTLHNNGHYFSIKWKFPFSESWSLFYYFGMNGLTGLSYKFEDGSAVSFGAGLRAKEFQTLDQSINKKTITLTWNAGLFYDLDNSLLTSLYVSGLTDYAINLNIYPGVIRMDKFSPGAWLVVRKDGKYIFGVTTIWVPGLGIEW